MGSVYVREREPDAVADSEAPVLAAGASFLLYRKLRNIDLSNLVSVASSSLKNKRS